MMVLLLDRGSTPTQLATWLGEQIQVGQDRDGDTWLRWESVEVGSVERIRHLPGRVYQVRDDGALVRPGDQIASARLDDQITWQELDQFLSVELPVAALAAKPEEEHRIRLQLVRGGEPRDAAAALIPLESFGAWVNLTSDIRLGRLRWVHDGESALVMGNPLPTCDFQPLIESSRVLVPAGWQWMPSVDVAWVRTAMNVPADHWLVWRQSDHWNIVADDAFATVRRSSVREVLDTNPSAASPVKKMGP